MTVGFGLITTGNVAGTAGEHPLAVGMMLNVTVAITLEVFCMVSRILPDPERFSIVTPEGSVPTFQAKVVPLTPEPNIMLA